MMRKIFFLICLVVGLSGCKEKGRNLDTGVIHNPATASGDAKNDLPVIRFEKTEHDFGRITQGEKVIYNFTFRNAGKSDLVISDVSTSCGCTVPAFPREAIKPGEEKSIAISFDSSGRKGFQNKTITVVSNTQPNKTYLKIKAQIVTP